jgi:hypothetical protein
MCAHSSVDRARRRTGEIASLSSRRFCVDATNRRNTLRCKRGHQRAYIFDAIDPRLEPTDRDQVFLEKGVDQSGEPEDVGSGPNE